MKKAFACLLVALLALNFSIVSFAKVGGFVSSPTGNQAPMVDSFKPGNADCDGTLVVTAYGDRAELPEDLRNLLEKAYKDVASTSDLTKISSDLAKIASDKSIKASDLAVSDLFNLHVAGCDAHEGHYNFDVTLSAETLNKFVALLQMNSDGTWQVVSGAQVINNGKSLKFSVKTPSPMAIVVNTGAGTDSPPTSDNWMIYVYGGVAAVSAVALVVIWGVWRKSKKQSDC